MNIHDTTPADTICAISTPPGVGGIAVARISGPDAFEITDRIWKGRKLSQCPSHTAHLGTIQNPDGSILDQAVATIFRAPGSFTGDNVVELSVHGSRFVQRELLRILTAAGCRLASPGEFTRRAFIAGKMDLAEAEAVAAVIASDSRAAHRIAISQMRGSYSDKLASMRQRLVDLAALLELELDFSEEDVEFASREKLLEIASQVHDEVQQLARSFSAGKAIKDGIPVAIAGHTNAGKSSLLNALLDDERAIVSDIHGTTRDTIEETLELGDYLFRFIDTAGLRQTTDTIEKQGIERTRQMIDRASIILLVIDPSETPDPDLIRHINHSAAEREHPASIIAVVNKSDIHDPQTAIDALSRLLPGSPQVTISAKNHDGIDTLCDTLTTIADRENGNADEGILVTNQRHADALNAAADSSQRTIDALHAGLSGDLIALDLRETIHHLATITSEITSTEILTTIFSRFCIGK